jgi:hypothetical protein
VVLSTCDDECVYPLRHTAVNRQLSALRDGIGATTRG